MVEIHVHIAVDLVSVDTHVLRAGTRVEGRVFLCSGVMATGGVVVIESEGVRVRRLLVREDGRFVAGGLAPGSYAVIYHAGRSTSPLATREVVVGSNRTEHVDVYVQP